MGIFGNKGSVAQKPTGGLDDAGDGIPVPDGAFVQVAVMGGDVQNIDFVEGMTVAAALKAAGVVVPKGAVVQLNGHRAQEDDLLDANSVLQVTTRVRNG
jgi:hypothetical protein